MVEAQEREHVVAPATTVSEAESVAEALVTVAQVIEAVKKADARRVVAGKDRRTLG